MSAKGKKPKTILMIVGCLSIVGCASIDHVHKPNIDDEQNSFADRSHAHEHGHGSVEGCYTITRVPSGKPHVVATNMFCIEEVAGQMWMTPTIGMDSWGTGAIRLHRIGSSNNFSFDVDIAGHEGGDHGNAHIGVFQLHVTPGTPSKATIRGVGRPGPGAQLHGGMAHSIQ